jgi:hypothetical protein
MNSSEDHSCIYSYYYNSCTPFFTCLLYSITPTRVITYLKLFSVSDFFKAFAKTASSSNYGIKIIAFDWTTHYRVYNVLAYHKKSIQTNT